MTTDEAKALVDDQLQVVNYSRVLSREDAYRIVTKIVNEFQPEIEKLKLENSQMSAKIFAYEAILQNSNFKMAVMRKKEEKCSK